VAKLHTGFIIIDKDIIFAITAESYCRGKATDVHGESSMETLPTPSSCVYGSLSVDVFDESDGKGVKRKLKIGSITMNMLITLSAKLQKDSAEETVNVEPEYSSTSLTINPLAAHIYYRSDNIKEYITAIRNSPMTYSPQKSISSLRQLISGFDDKSIYFYARASNEEFDVDQLMSATIFTVCELPRNQGYGS
jgi:hypothetical protein